MARGAVGITTSLDLEPFRLLYRRGDCFVVVASKAGGEFQQAALAVASLFQLPLFLEDDPQLEEWMTTDSFASHATFAAAGKRKPKGPFRRFEPAKRTARNLASLPACYVEIDPYEIGLDAPAAHASLLRAEEHGLLPQRTLTVWSGRGLRPLWVLKDEKGYAEPLATPAHLNLWQAVQQELIQLTASLQIGVDPKVSGPDRLVRFPGSINSKSGLQVRWEIHHPLKMYGLAELAENLGVTAHQAPTRALPATRTVVALRPRGRDADPGKRRAGRRRWSKPLEKVLELATIRGGCFHAGTRNQAAYFLAYFMARDGGFEPEIEERVFELTGVCRCSLCRRQKHYRSEVRATVRSAVRDALKGGHGPRNATIAGVLRVTDDEAKRLGYFRPKPKRATPEQRRSVLLHRLEGATVNMTLEELAAMLADAGLGPISPRTILTDVRALREQGHACEAVLTRKRRPKSVQENWLVEAG